MREAHQREISDLEAQLEEARRSQESLPSELQNFFARNHINTDEIVERLPTLSLAERYTLISGYYYRTFEPIFEGQDSEDLFAVHHYLETINIPVPTRIEIGEFRKKSNPNGSADYFLGTYEVRAAISYGANIQELDKEGEKCFVSSKRAAAIEAERNRINAEIRKEREAYDRLLKEADKIFPAAAFRRLAERVNALFERFLRD